MKTDHLLKNSQFPATSPGQLIVLAAENCAIKLGEYMLALEVECCLHCAAPCGHHLSASSCAFNEWIASEMRLGEGNRIC